MNSGRSSRCRFHTATIPSGSFRAAGFLLYEAMLSSGYLETPSDTKYKLFNAIPTFGDQSTSVIDRFFP